MEELKCCHCGDDCAEYFFEHEKEAICEMCAKDILFDEAKCNGDICSLEDLDDACKEDLDLYKEIKKRSE